MVERSVRSLPSAGRSRFQKFLKVRSHPAFSPTHFYSLRRVRDATILTPAAKSRWRVSCRRDDYWTPLIDLQIGFGNSTAKPKKRLVRYAGRATKPNREPVPDSRARWFEPCTQTHRTVHFSRARILVRRRADPPTRASQMVPPDSGIRVTWKFRVLPYGDPATTG